MSQRSDELRQYLINTNEITKQDKEYAMKFCNKTEYLDNLKQHMNQNLHCHIINGYGDVNSKICFVFKNEKDFKLLKPLLQPIFDKIKMNFWDVYVTFIDKTDNEYPYKYNYLMQELLCVSPKLVYVIDDSDVSYNAINACFAKENVSHPADKAFFISRQQLDTTNEANKNILWEMVKQLIKYR